MNKKVLLTGTLFCLSIISIIAQEKTASPQKENEFTFSVGPAYAALNNKNISNDDSKIVENKNGFNLDLNYTKYFTKRLGFGIGVGTSSYNQAIHQKGLFIKPNQTDIDGNNLDIWMNSNLEYTNKLYYADVPITFHLLLGHSSRFYGFVDIGIINQFLFSGKNTEKGTIENIGKYPTTDPVFSVISQNNSYYDYKSLYFNKKNEDTFKFYNLSGHLSFGIAAAMTDKLFLKFQPYVNMGFSDITAKNLKGKDYLDVFGDASSYQKTTTLSIGLNVGFAYNWGG